MFFLLGPFAAKSQYVMEKYLLKMLWFINFSAFYCQHENESQKLFRFKMVAIILSLIS